MGAKPRERKPSAEVMHATQNPIFLNADEKESN